MVLGGLLTLTMACAPTPPAPPAQSEEEIGARNEPGASCNASTAQALIGQTASSDIAAEAQALSGATAVRWLRPGQAVTMEYRADRLNLQLDEQDKVIAIRCG
jgi:hypothetical protein